MLFAISSFRRVSLTQLTRIVTIVSWSLYRWRLAGAEIKKHNKAPMLKHTHLRTVIVYVSVCVCRSERKLASLMVAVHRDKSMLFE